MNAHVNNNGNSSAALAVVGDLAEISARSAHTSPLAVADPKIRKLLQLAGLRFVCSRALWLNDEAKRLGIALNSGKMTSDEVDAKLEEMGALDLVYPELMGRE
jgi:hypothetical protein